MKRIYPKEPYRELQHFLWMQRRIAKGYATTTWSRSTRGFSYFLKSVGLIPVGLTRPSLGRKNHSRGYQPGNCKWQECKENSKEPSQRIEFKIARSNAMKLLWEDQNYKKEMTMKAKLESKIRTRRKDGTFIGVNAI